MKPASSLTLTAGAFLLLIQLAGASAAFAQLTLTTPLALSPSSPRPGQATTATFTAKNSGTGTVTIPYFLVGARSPSNANVDFPPSPTVTLGPGQIYTYRGTQSFSSAGAHSAWPVYYNGASWVELGPHMSFTVQRPSPGNLTVVTPLSVSPGSPIAGQSVTASFTVQNDGGSSMTVQHLLAAARSASNANVDFPAVGPITLAAGARYTYSGTRTLSAAGTYTAWPAAFLTDWTALSARMTFTVQQQTNGCWPSVTSGEVQYGYVPPAQTVGGGSTTFPVPAGYVHQTAWAETRGVGAADVEGAYAYDYSGWKSMVWRWADTMRQKSIQHLRSEGGIEAYRVELTPADRASPGTAGDHPRAEFFSVDPAEDRRQRTPPRENIFRDGDEYWATFALCLAGDFPDNHRWATLVQRKFQNNMPVPHPVWFTLNVHRTTVDIALPGAPHDAPYVPIASLSELKNRWVQFVFHERMSSGSNGYFEIFMNGVRKASRSGPTIPAGDINFNIHYGYYRANERDHREPLPPGIGVVYYSPFMIFRGSQAPAAPRLP